MSAAMAPALQAEAPSGSEPGRTHQGACSRMCSAMRADAAVPVVEDAQRAWAAQSVANRLQVVRRARHWMAAHAAAFTEAISPELTRSPADTLVTELLPLLEAMRFLERRAAGLLAPQKLGTSGRPLWLAGVQAEVQRVPLGHVLVIGPANFPLFLPGAQAMQALTAGNAVTWKPGAGGRRVALAFARALREAGLPEGVLHITDESVEAAQQALAQAPDKVIFTGGFESGRQVLRTLAETATPAVMELSGADAVVVLPSADLALVAEAIAFGLRLNGAEVCMSPRRVLGTAETLRNLRPLLEEALATVPPVALKAGTATKLRTLVEEAVAQGAQVAGVVRPEAQTPLLVAKVRGEMAIAQSDVFAPVLSLMEAPSVLHLPELVNACPYALTAAVFGEARAARALGGQLRVGTVLVNDLIAATADPRVPFGGRGRSGFGVTRGAEGLLEMTATRTMLVRRKGLRQHYKPAGRREASIFTGVIGALHGGSLRERLRAVRALVAAARQ